MNKYIQGEFYHIFNKSIANFKIFGDLDNCQRFLDTLCFYNNRFQDESFSDFLIKNKDFYNKSLLKEDVENYSFVKFISYCIMPDHYHLLVKVLLDNSLSKYISKVENSFTRYFNIKFNRKGPLWQTNFKSVRVKNNEQLLHLTRYIHLNPTTSNLVSKPEKWQFSSYKDYIFNDFILKKYLKEISIKDKEDYKKFVENRIDYQKQLKKIKKLIF